MPPPPPPMVLTSRAVVVTGVIRSLHEFAEEPAAAPQAAFLLTRDSPPTPVIVVLRAPIPCGEGDRAVIAGDLAEGTGLPPVLLSPRILSCRPRP